MFFFRLCVSIAGDACVPLISAHLEGAEQITLEGVYHSVDTPEAWYGAEEVVDSWLGAVMKELRTSNGNTKSIFAFPQPFGNLFR